MRLKLTLGRQSGSSDDIVVLEPTSGIATRTVRRVNMTVGNTTTPDIKLEHLVLVPDERRFLTLIADVPINSDPEPIAALFDAIVDSIRWLPTTEATDGTTH